jgi:hypothetical protein
MLPFLKWSVFVTGRFDSEGFDSFVHMDSEDLVLGLLVYDT